MKTALIGVATLPSSTDDSDWGIDYPYTLIAEGHHEFRFLHHDTILYKSKVPKVVLAFELLSDLDSVPLYKFYNAKKVQGHKIRNGKFKPGYHGDLVQDYLRILGLETPGRMDRSPFAKYRSGVIQADVKTVKKEGKVPYSVIKRLISLTRNGTPAESERFLSEYDSAS